MTRPELAAAIRELADDVGEIKVRWGRAELSHVEINGAGAETPLVAPSVTVGFAVAPLLGGKIVLTSVTLDHPRFNVVRGMT